MNREPKKSAWELDERWAVSKGERPEASLDDARYERALADVAATPPAELLAAATAAVKRRRTQRWWRGRRQAALAASGLAMAAAMALWVRSRGADEPYVAAKGDAAVEVAITRDGVAHAWDGTSALHPGDRLTFQVHCGGHAHVALATKDARGDLAPLWDMACRAGPFVFGTSLVVDDAPGSEEVLVGFADGPLHPRDLTRPSRGVTVRRLVFSKELPP